MKINKLIAWLGAAKIKLLWLLFMVVIGAYGMHIYNRKKTDFFFIGIFGGVAALPNDFALDARGIKELELHGAKGKVLIGQTLPVDFLKYMQSKTTEKNEKCGITVMKGKTDGLDLALLFNTDNYLFFAGVDSSVVENAISNICETRA